MRSKFDYFVVFAEMRTGSNFLEANLNAMEGVTCHGEAFNPHFIGYPNKTEILGISHEMREEDPNRLIQTIKQHSQGLGGFRYFHDHDPRVLDYALDDPRCAKIILTRNPLESYVSWKIAQTTGQWKLTNVKRRKDAKAVFNAEEFDRHVSQLQQFQVFLLNRLQETGDTAFYLAYEDLQNIAVMNGLAQFLGLETQVLELDTTLKPQNPVALEDKVENPADLTRAVSGLDVFNLSRTPNFEPRRGPVVPSYVAAPESGLLYMPIRSGPEARVCDWLARVDGANPDKLLRRFSQKTLRDWKSAHPGHRSFTVVRHPVARLHHAFCSKILSTGPGSFGKIRGTLRRFFKLPIPGKEPDESWTAQAHKEAFIAFAKFVKMNIAGQTSIRVDAHWSTQTQVVSNMSDFALPDMIIRETELERMLPVLAHSAGCMSDEPVCPAGDAVLEEGPAVPSLDDIYDVEVEKAVRDAYAKDYLTFGFSDWRD